MFPVRARKLFCSKVCRNGSRKEYHAARRRRLKPTSKPLREYRAMLAANKLPREEHLRRMREKARVYRQEQGSLTWEEYSRGREEKKQARVARIAAERAARKAAREARPRSDPKAKQKEWRKAHPDYMRNYMREWNTAHPDRKRREWKRQKHKLTFRESRRKQKQRWRKKPEVKIRLNRKRSLLRKFGPINPRGEKQWLRKNQAQLRTVKRLMRNMRLGSLPSPNDLYLSGLNLRNT
jgi:hypothetical protein